MKSTRLKAGVLTLHIEINDGVRNQPRTLVADLDFDVGPAGELLLAADLGDGGA